MRKDKLEFVRKGTLFSIIFLFLATLYFGFPLYIFLLTGEGYDLDDVIKKQANDEEQYLFGPAYSATEVVYKLNSASYDQHNILAVGTSRVLGFRSLFFNTSFYNTGRVIDSILSFEPFIKRIDDEKLPKIMIIGLDQNFFNDKWAGKRKTISFRVVESRGFLVNFKYATIKIYKDYFLKHKIQIEKLHNKNKNEIGLSAIMNHAGYRNDGSYSYGIVKDLEKKQNSLKSNEFKSTCVSLIENQVSKFETANDIGGISIEKLEYFLEYSKEKNIHVIGFLPPYAYEAWEEILNRKNNYSYILKLNATLNPLFERHGFSFFDFSDLRTLNASRCEIFDCTHASSKVYARMILKMAEKDPILNRNIRRDELRKRLAESNNCFKLFNE